MHQWVNYMNNSYIELYGPEIKVFRLDKVETEMHPLYMEETQKGRIYLPPIKMRSLHDDGKWRGNLGLNLYSENEPPMVIYVNFENMVQKMTEARRRHIANMYIKYTGRKSPFIQKKDNKLTIFLGSSKWLEFDLEDRRYSTIRKLGSYINSWDDLEVELEGENDLSMNILDFEKTPFSGRQVLVYTEDKAYDNVSDVIEMGDAILTNKWRLYEVQDAAPAGDFGWEYATWKIECKIASVENFNLPGNYIEQLKQNQYGLRSRVRMD